MKDPAVKEQLAAARSPAEVQSLVLRWIEAPEARFFDAAASKRERLELLNDFYRPRKETVMRIAHETGVTFRDLPGSGQAILTGPVSALQKLLGEGGPLERQADLEVFPNIRFEALPAK